VLERPPAEALYQAVLTANLHIHERGQANAEFQGMGTTCSVLVLLPRAALVAQVGDSRVYRLRGNKLEQLSFDHSLVWEMTAAGQMPRGEIASFIPKNIITRSLGPRADVQIDLEGPFPLEAGDTFLLCSDGLSGQIKDEEIGAILSVLSPQEAVRLLIDMANLRGGPDNITAVVARVTSVPAADAEDQASKEPLPAATSHPALWISLAVCVLFAIGLALTENYFPAMISILVAAAIATLALVKTFGAGSIHTDLALGAPLGKGPHSACACAPDAELAAVFCQLAQQLRQAAKEEHWTLDWGRFNAYSEQAQTALQKKQFAEAVRQYALAITFMMNEIRNQPSPKNQRDRSVLDL